MIDAYLDLVLEGDPSPGTTAVADRAGVSRASVFRYFETLEELRNEAMGRVLERFADLFELEDSPALTGQRRLASFVDSRLRFHETLHPLALLQRRQAGDSDHAKAMIDTSRDLLVEQVRSYFRRELEHLEADQQDDAVITVAVLTSIESWDHNQGHGRSPADVRRAWISAISAVIAGPGSHPQGDPP